MAFREVHLLQTPYQPRFSAVLGAVLDVFRAMPWIQGFPALLGRLGDPGGIMTAGGRQVGDAYCQKDCPEPSAYLPSLRGTAWRSSSRPPGTRGVNLRWWGAYASVAVHFLWNSHPLSRINPARP